MPVATATEVDAGGAPIVGARVVVRLLTSATDPAAPGYVLGEGLTISGVWATVTDEDGVWSTPDIPSTDDVVPANAVYVADLTAPGTAGPGRATFRRTFLLPSGGPHRVEDNLADPPADMPTLLSAVVADLAADTAAALAAEVTARTAAVAAEAAARAAAVPMVTGLAVNNTDAAGNATQIAAAIAAAPVGSTLRLPAGYIRATSIVNDRQVLLDGVGYWNNVNAEYGDAEWANLASFGGTVLILTATSGAGIDLQPQGPNAGGLAHLMVVGPGSGTSVGVQVGTAVAGPRGKEVVNDVLVANFSKNWNLQFCQECRWNGLSSIGGVDLLEVSDSFTNNEFNMTELQSGSGTALQYEGSLNKFNGLLVQACTGEGIICPPGFDQLLISNLWMENGVRGGLTGKALDLAGTGHRIDGAKLSYSEFDSNIDLSCSGSTFVNFIGDTPTGGATYTNTGVNNVFINADLNGSLDNTGATGATVLPNPELLSAIGLQEQLDLTVTPVSPVGSWAAQFGSLLPMQYNTSGAQNDSATFRFYVSASGTYSIFLWTERGPDSAIATVAVDGDSVGTVDLYAVSGSPFYSAIGGVVIASGVHSLTLTAGSKHASSSGYLMRLARATLARTV